MSNPDASQETETAPRPRRWLRRAMKVGLVLVVLLLLAPLALSLSPVRGMVAEKIGDALGAKVTLDGAFAYWFHGIDLEGMEVHSPAGYEHPVAKVEKVHVDVGVLGLLAGNVDAAVEITRPVITIRRKPGGESNLDAIRARLTEPKPEEEPSGGTATLALTIDDGVVDAQGAYGVEPTRLEALDLAASLAADGATRLRFDALAKNAQAGGGDAKLTTELTLDASGRGPWKIETSRLDLSRFSALLGGLGAVRTLSGQLEVSGAGTLAGPAAIQGKILATGAAIALETVDGARLGVTTLTGTFDGGQAEAESTFRIDLDAKDVRYEMPTETGSLRFAEPLVTIDAEGAYQSAADRVIVRTAEIVAGSSLNAVATRPWMVALGRPMTAQGVARIEADFARLGSLRSLSDALERITAGRMVANVNAQQGEGLDVSVGARIVGLTVASPLAGGVPYREPDLTLQARYGQVGEAQRLDLYQLTSTLASSTGTSAETPLIVRMRPGNVVVSGPIGLRVDLSVLSLLAPDALGLEPREVIEGQLELEGTATGDASKSVLSAALTGRGVRLPARWDRSRTPGGLQSTLRADMTDADIKLALTQLAGFGITAGTGSLRLVSEPEGMRVGPGALELGLDLAIAGPWLRPLLDLRPEARLAGQLAVNLNAVEQANGLVLKGITYAQNVFWQPTPADVPLKDSRISVEHDVRIAPEGERSPLTRLVIGVTGLTIDVSGSSILQSEDGLDLDVKGTLRGDAARLAPTVAALMGPSYADMRGSGAIQGTFKASGSPAAGGQDLLLDVALTAGSWTSGGLSIANTQVNARRAALADPIAAAINASFNQGPTSITGTYTPGPGPTPWTLVLNASRVDTSSLLVDRGPSRFLVFALPATLPSNAQTPVLSGLLDARVNLRSGDLASPGLLDGLRGTGHVAMQQGEIKNSTLFQGSDQGKLGALFKVLGTAVSEVGDVVKSLTRALTFQTLESDFTVADRRVTVQQAKLSGRYVALLTKGVVTFEKQVNLTTDLTLQGSAGEKAAKILPSPTIPLRVTGTMPNTVVTPNLDPSKLLGKGLLDKAKDLIDRNKPKDIVKDLRDLIK